MAHRPSFRARYAGTGLLAAGLAAAQAQAQEPKNWYVAAATDHTHDEVYRGGGWEDGGTERG